MVFNVDFMTIIFENWVFSIFLEFIINLRESLQKIFKNQFNVNLSYNK